MIEQVTDLDDPRLDDYRGLKGRPAKGTGGPVIVESLLGVEALAASGLAIRSVLVSPQKLHRLPALPEGTAVLVADLDVQRETVGFELHRGVVASAERPAPLDPAAIVAGARRVVVAERINDLENLGSLFRNARAFGADAVLLDPETADPLGRRPVRVSMGHVLHVPFARLEPWPDALDLVRQAGLTVVALAASGAEEGHQADLVARPAARAGGDPRRRRRPWSDGSCGRCRRSVPLDPDGPRGGLDQRRNRRRDRPERSCRAVVEPIGKA